ncbi:hypothetical protein PIROE2DRAFT_7097 [Piromyces sp. E2]|nr:hypothetical protein PIROE2DRAFT_7097 [Piromyces sp. E2]|eukprot:OUM65853.1 hypothetical protein PIROE2DRAFT_7097 [Piromyces sp. E2]
MKSSIVTVLCLSLVSMVYSDSILPAETIVPTETVTEAAAQPTISLEDKYFTCEVDDWKCKAEMSEKCFDDANECHLEAGTPIEECKQTNK